MAQQARPNVIGHMLDSLAQAMPCSSVVIRKLSSKRPSRRPIRLSPRFGIQVTDSFAPHPRPLSPKRGDGRILWLAGAGELTGGDGFGQEWRRLGRLCELLRCHGLDPIDVAAFP